MSSMKHELFSFWADFRKGMLIKEVGHQAVPFLRVEHQASDEVVKRNDRHRLGDQDVLRLL